MRRRSFAGPLPLPSDVPGTQFVVNEILQILRVRLEKHSWKKLTLLRKGQPMARESTPSSDEGRQFLRQLGLGFRPSVLLLTAHQAGILEALAEGPATPEAVAERLQADGRAVSVVLHALAAIDVLEKDEQRFRIRSALRPYLTPGRPEYLGDMLRHDFHLLKRWMQLPEVIKTGQPVRHQSEARNPQEKRDFILAMANLGWQSAREVAEAVDLSGVSDLLDLGGGPAVFAVVLCRHFPHLRVTLFDTEETLAVARQVIEQNGMQQRIAMVAGNFLQDPIPGEYDAVLMSSIVHIYGEEENRHLVEVAVRRLRPGGLMLIRDFLLSEDRTRPVDAALFAVNMLVNTHRGGCYTAGEIRSWLEAAGLQFEKQVPLPGASQLIVGRKPR